MTEQKGRPPTQADVGRRLTLRNDRGVRYEGILESVSRGGTAIILCFGIDYGGDRVVYIKPQRRFAMVMGAEVLDDA